ncbi:FecR domain-containing protein [Rhodopirellula sallentina]|nr:FecR family protein [Rhodopirellula sallentina]
MTPTEDLRIMIAEYARSEISEVRLRTLEAALREDDGFRSEFIEYMNIDAALGDLAALSETEIAQLHGSTNESADPYEGTTRIGRRSQLRWVALLAASLLVAVVCWWGFGEDARHENEVVQQNDRTMATDRDADAAAFATVVQSVDARWVDGSFAVGDRVSAEVIQLESGIVHLRFDSGVGVTLEGPAHFEVTSSEVTRLQSGVLTATVPPGAEGFRVDTPSAQVVDLGTAFGIDQRADGTSTVSVFDGEVEIVRTEESGKRLLIEGESVELHLDGSINDVKFASQPFEKLWPTASGIAGSTGAFRFAPPWPRRLSLIQSDTEIIVLPEGYARKLGSPCPLDMTESERSKSSIPTGRRVRSYLLQFNPVDPTGQEAASKELGSRMRRIEGSITFDRPVIGMIVSSETLNDTDELFSLRRGPARPFKRGLELSQPRTADVVSLSEDRHTVTLELAVFNQFSDHVRVIVDASLGEGEVQSFTTD